MSKLDNILSFIGRDYGEGDLAAVKREVKAFILELIRETKPEPSEYDRQFADNPQAVLAKDELRQELWSKVKDL